MNRLLVMLLVVLGANTIHSQDKPGIPFMPDDLKKVVIIQPTGETIDSLPEMKVLEDTTLLYQTTMTSIEQSFVNDMLDLYFLAEIYLKNQGVLDTIEPAYLALTKNQGGFAKFGFTISQNGEYIRKPHAPYIDIVEHATDSPDELMSFTQLYPHEMGHVIFHLLSPEDSLANNTKNVDVHFFSIVTDYSTAFNEGFAEHIENVSRTYETNATIKAGIFADIEQVGQSSIQSINGFKRDFKYPFRLGYYKASMLNWYQKYEDYKRHVHAFSGDVRYKNEVLSLSNKEDQLTFRNAGIGLQEAKRNLVQLYATEGAISSFFTHLSTSDLQNQYLDTAFYKPFLYDSTAMNFQSPMNVFTPLQNQFIKYFYVLHKYVVFNNSSKAQLIDFIDGYIESFPGEERAVKDIFKQSLGVTYTNQLPPPLWLLVKDYPHRLLVFDPFDAITVPVYTFDLNAAEVEDLMTIKGVTSEAAQKVVDYRNANGFFISLEQVKTIPGLSDNIANQIISAKLNDDYFENALKDFEPKLTISALLTSPLKYVFFRAVLYFFLLFAVGYFFLIRQNSPSTKKVILLSVKYFLLWVLFVLVGLVAVFLTGGSAYLYVVAWCTLLLLIAFLMYRKKRLELRRTFIFTGGMMLLILMSII